MHFDGYVQPITFIDFDIVITSYQCLAKDLNFSNEFVSMVGLYLWKTYFNLKFNYYISIVVAFVYM